MAPRAAIALAALIVVGAGPAVAGDPGTPPSETTAVQPGAPQPFTGDASQTEIVFWQSIENSTNPDDFRAYLSRYPDGSFASLARNRIAALQAVAGDARAHPGPVQLPNSAPAAPARVYIYIGRDYWTGGSDDRQPGSFEIAVDGAIVAHLHHGEALAADLSPGAHQLTRYQWTIWGPLHPVAVSINVAPGETHYIAADHYQGYSTGAMAAGALFGLVGALAVQASASQSADGHPLGDYLEERPDGVDQTAGFRVISVSRLRSGS